MHDETKETQKNDETQKNFKSQRDDKNQNQAQFTTYCFREQ